MQEVQSRLVKLSDQTLLCSILYATYSKLSCFLCLLAVSNRQFHGWSDHPLPQLTPQETESQFKRVTLVPGDGIGPEVDARQFRQQAGSDGSYYHR